MIIDLKKYLLLGAKEEIDCFFERAQAHGMMEFIPSTSKKPVELPLDIQHLHNAMRVLRRLPVKAQYEGSVDLKLADEMATHVLELKAEVERLAEEKRLLELEIVRISPFGDFSLDDIDFIEKEGKKEIQFFCMKSVKAKNMDFDDGVIPITTEYDLSYFLAVNNGARAYPDMIEMRIDKPLGELYSQLQFVKESLCQMEAELKGHAGHLHFLHDAYLIRLNAFHLALAKQEVTAPLEGASLFAIEAWVPANKIQVLYRMLDGLAIHCEAIIVEETDRVPTYMENAGVSQLGEDLVRIYDIPAATDRDPSWGVFWFFALFFAMIVADGGYGLLYLGLCLYFKYKFPSLSGQKRRFLKLATILSSACVLWGLVTTSFFGMEISPKSVIGELSPVRYLVVKKADYHFLANDDVKQEWITKYPQLVHASSGQEFVDQAVIVHSNTTKHAMFDAFSDNLMLELSLVIGVIHIAYGFLRYLFRHWAGLGWVIFMVGAYLYFPASMLNATTMVQFLDLLDKPTAAAIGLQLIYVGVVLALLLALVQKRLKGLGEISNLIQVFADVLSYLRLYALGLAGSMMAATFNEIGQEVGLVLGVIVILVGHSVNILLGIMAGVIHGLRLNFIEWYHYCFDGGGRLFRPLMRFKREH